MILQVRSVGHTTAGVLGILMCLSTMYYFYYVFAGWKTMRCCRLSFTIAVGLFDPSFFVAFL